MSWSLAFALVGLLTGACAPGAVPGQTTEQRPTSSTSTSSTSTSTTAPLETPQVITTTSVAPAPDLAPDLLVVGDWGSGTLPQGAVAGAMQRYAESTDVAAVLTTGDNFYSDNADFLMQPFEWVEESGIPFWLTWGNHDIETETREQVVDDVFDSPPRWTTYEWGPIDVIILDSNQVDSIPQAAFFLNAMAASDRPTIVSLHHPPYSCSHHGSTTDVVNQFVGVLDDDIFLVLAGHDHSYQRFENEGVSYVVTGGGGRALRPLTECPENHPERLAGAEAFHFVALHQTETTVDLFAIDVNGDVIDEVSLELP